MKQVKFSYTLSEECLRAKQEEIQNLKDNVFVRQFMQEENVPYSVFEEQVYRIKEYVQIKEKCAQCTGLQNCNQPVKGHALHLYYDGVLDTRSTPCLYEKEKARALKHKQKFLLCDMSDAQLRLRLMDLDLTQESAQYFKLIAETMEGFKNGFTKGFYLCGQPGSGKTYLSCCIINQFALAGYRCAFVNVAKYFDTLKSNMYDALEYKKLITALRKADVIVLDDIATEKVSAWSRDEVLMSILDERMENNRLTFFTSNYSMSNLELYYTTSERSNNVDVGAIRLVERMKALSNEKVLNCGNRRIK